jgi:PKD repeat protein
VIEDSTFVSTAGQAVLTEFALCGFTVEHEVLCNFTITGSETSSGSGEGGFETVSSLKIPGPGGTSYSGPAAPVANFSASATSGAHPLTVTFTNTSTGPRNGAAWDFNDDGTVDSFTDTTVAVTYSAAGTYSVALTVFNSSGFSTKESVGYIIVS